MESLRRILELPYASVALLVLFIAGAWFMLPYLAAAGRAIVAFAVNLCFAIFALGILGFLAFGLIRTIFHPLF
jgi:hypothetical protein